MKILYMHNRETMQFGCKSSPIQVLDWSLTIVILLICGNLEGSLISVHLHLDPSASFGTMLWSLLTPHASPSPNALFH